MNTEVMCVKYFGNFCFVSMVGDSTKWLAGHNSWRVTGVYFSTHSFLTIEPCNVKNSQKISKWWEMTGLFFCLWQAKFKCKWVSGSKEKYGGRNLKIESDLWKKSMMVRSRRPITIPKAGTCSNNLHQGREEYIEGSVRILWSLTGPNE